MVEPFEARRLPELIGDEVPTELRDEFNNLLIAVNGSPYYGERSDAIVLTLRWLRANPDQADILLNR
jgi:hypothetical protein